MRILIVSDAPRTLPTGVGTFRRKVGEILKSQGHELFYYDTLDSISIPDPTGTANYIAIPSKKRFGKFYEQIMPDAVHIETEGPVGYSARKFCSENAIPFTAAYHTNMDYILKKRLCISENLTWKYLRWFYRDATKIHVATSRIGKLLRKRKILNDLVSIPLGVDREKFHYMPNQNSLSSYKKPFFMTMSRIGKEKNLEAFLDLDLPGTKFIIGEGPHQKLLEKKYKGKFHTLSWNRATEYLSQGDVFIFPSKFDTFGLVIIEAMACGLPVAAYPVMGPLDIIEEGVTGFLSENLKEAALASLDLDKASCIEASKKYSWETTANLFIENLAMIDSEHHVKKAA